MFGAEKMKNIMISNLHKKDVKHSATKFGLFLRRKIDKPFKKLCNIVTKAHIINKDLSSDENVNELNDKKNNIVLERYPKLNPDEPYIFVCNHTCPEDIETVLNIFDRNAYLVLGSLETLQYNRDMYSLFLSGIIPFDIMDPKQRKLVFQKMKRIIQSNSILIFPEGSHNYTPNKLINKLYDGPVNLALQTNRKIVVTTLIKDKKNNVAYIDVGDPIDVRKINVNMDREFNSSHDEMKHYVKSLTSVIRDNMATAAYSIIERHFETLNREDYDNLEEKLRMMNIEDSFKQMKWKRDVFEAEFLTKKSKEDLEHEEIIRTLSNLTLNPNACVGNGNKEWILKELDLNNKDIPNRMRQHLELEKQKKKKVKVLTKGMKF